MLRRLACIWAMCLMPVGSPVSFAAARDYVLGMCQTLVTTGMRISCCAIGAIMLLV